MTASRRKFLALSLIVVWMAAAAFAQDAENRRQVAQVLGTISRPNLSLALPHGPGSTRQAIERPTAEGLRFHIRFAGREDAGDTWSLRLLDADGKAVYSVRAAEVKSDDLWLPETNGKKATLEVNTECSASPLQVTLDRLVVLRSEPTGASITGTNDLAPIGHQEDWLVDLGRAVAKLRIATDNDWYHVCTGFLVSSDLMLTNEHCIASDDERASTIVQFDYDTSAAQPVAVGLSELLGSHENLDYALVRLAQPVADRTPLRLDLEHEVVEGEQLVIIQHPGGQSKKVSVKDCVVEGVGIRGRHTEEKLDFGHRCDTMTGSSGSPVLDLERRTVVGLHHLGFREDSGVLVNSAVSIRRVFASLESKLRIEIQGLAPGPVPGK